MTRASKEKKVKHWQERVTMFSMRRVARATDGMASDAHERLLAGDANTRRALSAAITQLEHSVSLLRLNLNEATALENFLLESLRIWSAR